MHLNLVPCLNVTQKGEGLVSVNTIFDKNMIQLISINSDSCMARTRRLAAAFPLMMLLLQNYSEKHRKNDFDVTINYILH